MDVPHSLQISGGDAIRWSQGAFHQRPDRPGGAVGIGSTGGGGGAAGGGGFNFQARATAAMYAYLLAGKSLNFVAGRYPVPLAVSAESGGPGDDVRIECEDDIVFELQAKRGLQAREGFWDTVTRIIRGLVDEPELLGVLLVDYRTSLTVREEFRRGVRRLADGRRDGLNSVTEEFLNRLEGLGITDLSVLTRFEVVVRDLDEGSQGHENALLTLDGVAEDVRTAWSALDSDAHALIENRGRRDAEALALILTTKGGGISKQAEQPAVVAQAYRDWLSEKTSHFRVPGAAVSLEIREAWAELEVWQEDGSFGSDGAGSSSRGRTMEEQIASYREWSRLGLRDGVSRSDQTFSADNLPMAGDRLVVVAKPGAGKSTLQQRLAHGLSRTGANVAHVRLPLVAERMRSGSTFGNAVLDISGSDSGLPRDTLLWVLDRPDYLLADGLDECGESREVVVEGLTGWAAGRGHTRVLVTTRPVGYDAALLPGWQHLELLPLDENGARAHAQNVLRELQGNGEAATSSVETFMDSVGTNETAKRAAGNPLLLGFLIRLYTDAIPFGRRRAELYAQIVRRVRDRSPRGDSGEDLDASTADRALDIVAWYLQEAGVLSGDRVSEQLGRILREELGIPSLAARVKADKCLEFWEERGLVERLTAGSREALVLSHAGLGEYSAARYASELSLEELERWVTEARRNPKWREVILLAAGVGAVSVVGILLELYDPADPVGEELELAARALAEVAEPPDELTSNVVEAIGKRLQADIPAVAFAAAESIMDLARESPVHVARAAGPLVRHQSFTTRVAATRVLLECGSEHADLDATRDLITELLEPNEGERDLPQRRNPFLVWKVQDRVAFIGIKQLLELDPGPETDGLVERVASSHTGIISAGTHMNLLQYLHECERDDVVERIKGEERYDRITKRFASAEEYIKANRDDIEEDRRFLELAIEATCIADDEAAEPLTPAEAHTLAMLVQGLEFGQYVVGSWELMVDGGDESAVRATLAGGMAVLGIDTELLAREANGLVRYLDQVDPTDGLYRPIYGKLPSVPVDPRWDRAADVEVAVEDLVRAIAHPSVAISTNAAYLIAHGAGVPEAKDLIMATLEGSSENTYRAVAILADRVWCEEEALENLLAALPSAPPIGSYWLLIALSNLKFSKDDERALGALLDGLKSEDADLATRLAETMAEADPSEFPLFGALTPRLGEVFEHWTMKHSAAEETGGDARGGQCPRAALVRLLGDAQMLGLADLMELCRDSSNDVQRSAAAQTVAAATRQRDLRTPLGKIAAGELPSRVLQETLALPPEELEPFKEEISDLLSSDSENIRKQVVGALATPGWIDSAQANTLAEAALADRDAAVRDRAVETLRTLREDT